ncbi:MAG: class II aldolase/adducin family protein [Candidatus Pacebacteria bacterium]|nr:class II aldolase/adducin family protein [Candidatus Paceibacterota bacterium]
MTNKIVHVIGGGTRFYIDSHLYLGSKALGNTARRIVELCRRRPEMDVRLHLTAMAEPFVPTPVEEMMPGCAMGSNSQRNTLDTNADLNKLVEKLVADPTTKIVFFNAAVVDFEGQVSGAAPSDKYAERLSTSAPDGSSRGYLMHLTPSEKIVRRIRATRKDIFLVAFKQTSGASADEQYRQGLNMLKAASANLVLANDSKTRLNMIIVPEEATYHVTTDRRVALDALVEMAYLRSHLTFTRSTVVAGEPVPWESDLVPPALRAVVDHCIERGAYKKFRGVTAGHFAVKVDDTTFLTSRRKTDFNDMKRVGLVKVKTDGPDSVIAYGSKPSVGGQSQRIVFTEHEDADCIVHFHCPKKPDSLVPTVSQREYECGSHECGRNTSRGLKRFGNLLAVYLDEHGPNIVFSKSIDPQEVVDFIEANFVLTDKTGGYAIA